MTQVLELTGVTQYQPYDRVRWGMSITQVWEVNGEFVRLNHGGGWYDWVHASALSLVERVITPFEESELGWRVHSDYYTSNHICYIVRFNDDGSFTCTCPGHRSLKHKDCCKHVSRVQRYLELMTRHTPQPDPTPDPTDPAPTACGCPRNCHTEARQSPPSGEDTYFTYSDGTPGVCVAAPDRSNDPVWAAWEEDEERLTAELTGRRRGVKVGKASRSAGERLAA